MTDSTSQTAGDTANRSIGPVRLSSGHRYGLRAAALAGLTFAAIVASDGEEEGNTGTLTGMTKTVGTSAISAEVLGR